MSDPAPRFRTLLWVAGGVLLAALGLSALQAWGDLQAGRRQEREVQSEIDEVRQRVERLEGGIQALRDDPVALEHVARERLGLAREGEIVVILPETETAASDADSDPSSGTGPEVTRQSGPGPSPP